MKEALIFVLCSEIDWEQSCIYQDRNKQWSDNFLEDSHFDIQQIYSNKFFFKLVKRTPKFLLI